MNSTIELDELKSYCNKLQNIVKPGFGPNALNTMLCTSTGKIIISNHGYIILDSVHFGHPIGRMISHSLLNHVKMTGDNSKTFILILDEIITNLCVSQARKSLRNKSSEFLKALPDIKSYFLNVFVPNLMKQAVVTCIVKEERENIEVVMRNILISCFQGKLQNRTLGIIANQILGLVLSNIVEIESLSFVISDIISQFDFVAIECAGYPINATKIIDGFIIERDFLFAASQVLSEKIKFVVFGSEIDKLDVENSSVRASDESILKRSMKLKEDVVSKVINVLLKNGVNLLLCSHKISEVMLNYCRQAEISVLHYVPDDVLTRLTNWCDINIFYEVQEIIGMTASADYVGYFDVCDKILLNGHSCVHLKNDNWEDDFTKAGHIIPKHLLVCAPSIGICGQISKYVYSALKVLKMWLDGDNILGLSAKQEICQQKNRLNTNMNSEHIHGYSFIGGGAFEIQMSGEINKILQELSKKQCIIDSLGILQKSVKIVPLSLLQNSYATNAHKLSYIHLDQLINAGEKVVGVNAKTGISVISGDNIVEPVAGKVILYLNVLDLVQQLLRIDSIVSVVKLPSEKDDDDDI